MAKKTKLESEIEELCKKYDNLIPAGELKKIKVPLLGEANCTK